MGAIRGILLVFVAVLLFFSIFCAALFWTLSLSLNYNTLENQSTLIIKDILQKDANVTNIIDTSYQAINYYCQQNNTSYVFSAQNYTFDISCATAAKGKEAIVDEAVKSLVHDLYYAKYDCKFLECIAKPQLPLFLVSEKAYNFWTGKIYFALVAFFILLALTFILIEKKTNLPLLVGSLMIVVAIPFLKLDSLLSLFTDKILFKLLGIFFSQSFYVSIRILIIGIALILVGVVFKIFKIGFSIEKIFSKVKEVKDDSLKSMKESSDKIAKKLTNNKSK